MLFASHGPGRNGHLVLVLGVIGPVSVCQSDFPYQSLPDKIGNGFPAQVRVFPYCVKLLLRQFSGYCRQLFIPLRIDMCFALACKRACMFMPVTFTWSAFS